MSTTTDWKGNVIKEGDEICLIKFLHIDYFGKTSWMIPQEDRIFKEFVVKEKPEPDKEVWEVGNYHLVRSINGCLCLTEKHGELEVTTPISTIMFFRDERCFQIGIKGVSDTKE